MEIKMNNLNHLNGSRRGFKLLDWNSPITRLNWRETIVFFNYFPSTQMFFFTAKIIYKSDKIGLLIVPYALSSGGWLSLLLFFVIAPMTFYTGLLLKTCLDAGPSIGSYLDIAEQAIGKTGRIIVTIIMNSELYLVGMGLLILEADNLHKLSPKFMIKIGTQLLREHSHLFLITALVILP
ncbi:hypothetical protein ACSBR2_017340 [Camellia fascicularis]